MRSSKPGAVQINVFQWADTVNPLRVLGRLVARQLGHPKGLLGAVIARVLNKGNAPTIAAAVAALELAGTETAADIGFGGGLGLHLLLAATAGDVHGVEPSPDMIRRARRSHRRELDAGRLHLHVGTMQALPLAAASLDGWISLNTVYFISDLAPAFADLHRVLRPSGRGVLGVADPGWLDRQPFARHGFLVRPVRRIAGALADAGFSVEHRTAPASRSSGGGTPYNLLICRPG